MRYFVVSNHLQYDLPYSGVSPLDRSGPGNRSRGGELLATRYPRLASSLSAASEVRILRSQPLKPLHSR